MYNATYLVNYIPKEKKDLLGLDIDNVIYANLENMQNSILPANFPTVYNLYKNNKDKISDFIKQKLDNIDTSDLEGFGKIENNLNQFYNFNIFKPLQGQTDSLTEQKFKSVFLNKCVETNLLILIGSVRNESIEICNNITISPEDLAGALPKEATIVLGGFSKVFVTNLLSIRKDLNIIFSTTVSSWIDYEDVKIYLNYLNYVENNFIMHPENIANYMAIGELKLRKSLLEQPLADFLNSYDNGNRIISYMEGLYLSEIYGQIENKLNIKENLDKDVMDYILFLEAEMMCFPFAFVLGDTE